ncbi:carbohydrate sulfotransferase [Elysia marginata]|uniref:Carbohydrate sulfotransferase n=1 Tax=Elysia marginata TaxID=1093978 RepID=A0AAV4I8U1_9GAST|nr:carbohydrate sulfotransferase [Elysia marginata]
MPISFKRQFSDQVVVVVVVVAVVVIVVAIVVAAAVVIVSLVVVATAAVVYFCPQRRETIAELFDPSRLLIINQIGSLAFFTANKNWITIFKKRFLHHQLIQIMGRSTVLKDLFDRDWVKVEIDSFHTHRLCREMPKWKRWLLCCLYVLSRRQVKTLVFGTVMLVLFCHLYQVGIHKHLHPKKFGPSRACGEKIRRRAYRRLSAWEKGCIDLNFPSHSHDPVGYRDLHFSDKNKHFVFCSVPEVGDTFWKSVIRYVNNSSRAIQGTALDVPRWQTYFLAPTSMEEIFGTTIKFIYSEDPYVRLWKMWVEKFYLSGYWLKAVLDLEGFIPMVLD